MLDPIFSQYYGFKQYLPVATFYSLENQMQLLKLKDVLDQFDEPLNDRSMKLSARIPFVFTLHFLYIYY